jgi:hypothetical protein
MTIDPSDGCTFWYTGEYYDAHPTTKLEDNWQTRIASFQLPGCSGSTPAAPAVSGFTPVSGPVGTPVTINGSNFTGATSVTFNGTAATFTITNDSSINTTVPTGASTGVVGVTGPGGTGTSSGVFTVEGSNPSAPTITSFSPTSGKIGTAVTITGTNFTGASKVTFGGGVTASFTVVGGTQVTTTVPTGAKNGPISVTTPAGTATSSQTFRVTKR